MSFYHVQIYDRIIENECISNLTEEQLMEMVVNPYHEGRKIVINGRPIPINNINRIKIFKTENLLTETIERFESELSQITNGWDRFDPEWRAIETGKNVTNDFITAVQSAPKTFKSVQTKSDQNKYEMDIFISHASSDVRIAEALINFVQRALLIQADRIRCTSVDGYKLPIGIVTDDRLKREIFSAKVFIGIITSESINSTYVLFELGARWGIEKPLLPLICDQRGYSLLEDPLKNINALRGTHDQDLHQFIEDLGKYLNVKPQNASSYLNDLNVLKELSKRHTKMEEVAIEENIHATSLSNEARILLKDAVRGTTNEIIKAHLIGEMSIEIDGKEYVEDDSGRTKAKWQAAMNELIDLGLVENRNGGSIYRVTNRGFEQSDSLG